MTEMYGKQFIQTVTGKFLYLGRAADLTILTALSALASQQAAPTEETKRKAKQLLDYLATQECAGRGNHVMWTCFADAIFAHPHGHECVGRGNHVVIGIGLVINDGKRNVWMSNQRIETEKVFSAMQVELDALVHAWWGFPLIVNIIFQYCYVVMCTNFCGGCTILYWCMNLRGLPYWLPYLQEAVKNDLTDRDVANLERLPTILC